MPIDDRAALFGDSCFTTIAVSQGQPEFLDAHWRRLQESVERLKIGAVDWPALRNDIARACDGVSQAVLRVMISRGQSASGYRVPASIQSHRYLSLRAWPEVVSYWAENGIAVRHCATRLSQHALLAGLKHGNRLEQILARSEWQDDSFAEGLMCDQDGFLIEGTCANLFFVDQYGVLCTPSLHMSGVAGVMRSLVLADAELQGLSVQIADFMPDVLQTAREIFMSNCVMAIVPVTRVAEQSFPVGALTRQLQQRLIAPLRQQRNSSP